MSNSCWNAFDTHLRAPKRPQYHRPNLSGRHNDPQGRTARALHPWPTLNGRALGSRKRDLRLTRVRSQRFALPSRGFTNARQRALWASQPRPAGCAGPESLGAGWRTQLAPDPVRQALAGALLVRPAREEAHLLISAILVIVGLPATVTTGRGEQASGGAHALRGHARLATTLSIAYAFARTRACRQARPDDRFHVLGARRVAIGLPRMQ